MDLTDGKARNEAAARLAPSVLEILRSWRRSGVAISRGMLCERLKADDRVVRAALVELRVAGEPVIAEEGGGYRLAQTPDELEAYLASLRSRVSALREVIDALERAKAKLDDDPLQPSLL